MTLLHTCLTVQVTLLCRATGEPLPNLKLMKEDMADLPDVDITHSADVTETNDGEEIRATVNVNVADFTSSSYNRVSCVADNDIFNIKAISYIPY